MIGRSTPDGSALRTIYALKLLSRLFAGAARPPDTSPQRQQGYPIHQIRARSASKGDS